MRVIFPKPDGGVSIAIPTDEFLQTHTMEDVAAQVVPAGVPYAIVEDSEIPSDRFFRDAWAVNGSSIEVRLDKAKVIAHDRRRAAREKDFAPFDDIIAKQIPGASAQQAEAERQKIRDKYAAMQTAIDAAQTPNAIKAALEGVK